MALRDELERALLASWNTGDLTVYADHLQALGDPRGELIALDLAPRGDRAWREHRRALLQAWLGPKLAASAGHFVQHGVIHELRDGHGPPDLLESPLGAFVRGFSTWGGVYSRPLTVAVLQALERLAAQPRPWLTRLVIDYQGELRCAPALCERLIAATPNLVELYTLGDRLFDSFHHPSLRRLYATPAFQPPVGGGVPHTGAEVIELFHYGIPTTSFALEDDLGVVRTLLEAIETTADCNELYATYGDLVQEHDSMPAVLMRLDEAGLVTLDGPFAELTAAGRGLLRWPTVRDRSPPAVPPSDADNRKWVLWAMEADRRALDSKTIIAGLLRTHCELLVACLAQMPLERAAREVIRDYLEFLCEVVAAGEWTAVALTIDRASLAATLRMLLVLHQLTDYQIDCFDDIGDSTDWSYLEQLVEFLESLQDSSVRAVFRVAWGF